MYVGGNGGGGGGALFSCFEHIICILLSCCDENILAHWLHNLEKILPISPPTKQKQKPGHKYIEEFTVELMGYLFLAHCYVIMMAAWSNRKTSSGVSEQLCDPRAYHSTPAVSLSILCYKECSHLLELHHSRACRTLEWSGCKKCSPFFLSPNLTFLISLLLC